MIVLGPNASGKSTLLRTLKIAGWGGGAPELFAHGTMRVDGVDQSFDVKPQATPPAVVGAGDARMNVLRLPELLREEDKDDLALAKRLHGQLTGLGDRQLDPPKKVLDGALRRALDELDRLDKNNQEEDGARTSISEKQRELERLAEPSVLRAKADGADRVAYALEALLSAERDLFDHAAGRGFELNDAERVNVAELALQNAAENEGDRRQTVERAREKAPPEPVAPFPPGWTVEEAARERALLTAENALGAAREAARAANEELTAARALLPLAEPPGYLPEIERDVATILRREADVAAWRALRKMEIPVPPLPQEIRPGPRAEPAREIPPRPRPPEAIEAKPPLLAAGLAAGAAAAGVGAFFFPAAGFVAAALALIAAVVVVLGARGGFNPVPWTEFAVQIEEWADKEVRASREDSERRSAEEAEAAYLQTDYKRDREIHDALKLAAEKLNSGYRAVEDSRLAAAEEAEKDSAIRERLGLMIGLGSEAPATMLRVTLDRIARLGELTERAAGRRASLEEAEKVHAEARLRLAEHWAGAGWTLRGDDDAVNAQGRVAGHEVRLAARAALEDAEVALVPATLTRERLDRELTALYTARGVERGDGVRFRDGAEHAEAYLDAARRLKEATAVLEGEEEKTPDEWRHDARALREQADRLTGQRDVLSTEIGALGQRIRDAEKREDRPKAAAQAEAERDRLRDEFERYTVAKTAGALREELVAISEERFLPAAVGASREILHRIESGYTLQPTSDGFKVVEAGMPSKSLGQLSDGTRVQAILAARLGALRVDGGPKMPLLVDEGLANTDPDRMERIMEILLEESRERQVVVFTNGHDEVARWRAVASRIGLDEPPVRLLGGRAPTAPPTKLPEASAFAPPDPTLPWDEYLAELNLLPHDPWSDELHLARITRSEEQAQLHGLLLKGVDTTTKLRHSRPTMDDAYRSRLLGRAVLYREAAVRWRENRPRPLRDAEEIAAFKRDARGFDGKGEPVLLMVGQTVLGRGGDCSFLRREKPSGWRAGMHYDLLIERLEEAGLLAMGVPDDLDAVEIAALDALEPRHRAVFDHESPALVIGLLA